MQRLHQRQLGSVAAHVAQLGGRDRADVRTGIGEPPAGAVDRTGRFEVAADGGSGVACHHRREPAQRLGKGGLVLGWDIGRVVTVEQVECDRLHELECPLGRPAAALRAQPAGIQRDGESHGESCQGKRGEEDREHQPW
jgi:hypothetical protein